MGSIIIRLQMSVLVLAWLCLLLEPLNCPAQFVLKQNSYVYVATKDSTTAYYSKFLGISEEELMNSNIYFNNHQVLQNNPIPRKLISEKVFLEKRFMYIAPQAGILKDYSIFLGISEKQLIAQNLHSSNIQRRRVQQGDSIALSPLPTPTEKLTTKPQNPPNIHNPVVNPIAPTNNPDANEAYIEENVEPQNLYKQISYKGKRYSVFEVDPKSYKFDLFNKSENRRSLFDFLSVDDALNGKLIFAMNAGMFTPNYDPEGLFIKNGKEYAPINLEEGPETNFYMMPNGIFMIDKKNVPNVLTTKGYQDYLEKHRNDDIRLATQSGPMLVIDGKYHPKFVKGSKNLNIRNGVGVSKNNNVYFIMSEDPVTFYELAELFKQQYGCDNALYLDGFVSQIYVPQRGNAHRGNTRSRLGTILSVSKP